MVLLRIRERKAGQRDGQGLPTVFRAARGKKVRGLADGSVESF